MEKPAADKSNVKKSLMKSFNFDFSQIQLDKTYMHVTEDPFLIALLAKLGTCFASPEEEFMKQGAWGNDMYFIS